MFGIDVSHHQNPATLSWPVFAASSEFCICRASYGTMRDTKMPAHVARARDVGLLVGAYHFFRPSQDWRAQLEVFFASCDAAGYGAGDIVPVLDVEHDPLPKPGVDVSPAWQEPVRALLDAIAREYGGAMVYVTQREFGMLGKPAWLLEYPLWVAHYTGASKPATPGNQPWKLWQHRVGPYDPDGAGGYVKERPELDQNRSQGELPLAVSLPAVIDPAPLVETFDDDSELEALIEVYQAEHIHEIFADNQRDAHRQMREGDDE